MSKINPFSPSPDATLEAGAVRHRRLFTGGRIRPCASRVASELNPLATHAPWELMQRLTPLHECGGAGVPPHLWTRFAASTERIPVTGAFSICITFVQPIFTAKQGEQAR